MENAPPEAASGLAAAPAAPRRSRPALRLVLTAAALLSAGPLADPARAACEAGFPIEFWKDNAEFDVPKRVDAGDRFRVEVRATSRDGATAFRQFEREWRFEVAGREYDADLSGRTLSAKVRAPKLEAGAPAESFAVDWKHESRVVGTTCVTAEAATLPRGTPTIAQTPTTAGTPVGEDGGGFPLVALIGGLAGAAAAAAAMVILMRRGTTVAEETPQEEKVPAHEEEPPSTFCDCNMKVEWEPGPGIKIRFHTPRDEEVTLKRPMCEPLVFRAEALDVDILRLECTDELGRTRIMKIPMGDKLEYRWEIERGSVGKPLGGFRWDSVERGPMAVGGWETVGVDPASGGLGRLLTGAGEEVWYIAPWVDCGCTMDLMIKLTADDVPQKVDDGEAVKRLSISISRDKGDYFYRIRRDPNDELGWPTVTVEGEGSCEPSYKWEAGEGISKGSTDSFPRPVCPGEPVILRASGYDTDILKVFCTHRRPDCPSARDELVIRDVVLPAWEMAPGRPVEWKAWGPAPLGTEDPEPWIRKIRATLDDYGGQFDDGPLKVVPEVRVGIPDELINRLRDLQRQFKDLRGHLHNTNAPATIRRIVRFYNTIIDLFIDAAKSKKFERPCWVLRMVACFQEAALESIRNWYQGGRDRVPDSWGRVFRQIDGGAGMSEVGNAWLELEMNDIIPSCLKKNLCCSPKDWESIYDLIIDPNVDRLIGTWMELGRDFAEAEPTGIANLFAALIGQPRAEFLQEARMSAWRKYCECEEYWK